MLITLILLVLLLLATKNVNPLNNFSDPHVRIRRDMDLNSLIRYGKFCAVPSFHVDGVPKTDGKTPVELVIYELMGPKSDAYTLHLLLKPKDPKINYQYIVMMAVNERGLPTGHFHHYPCGDVNLTVAPTFDNVVTVYCSKNGIGVGQEYGSTRAMYAIRKEVSLKPGDISTFWSWDDDEDGPPPKKFQFRYAVVEPVEGQLDNFWVNFVSPVIELRRKIPSEEPKILQMKGSQCFHKTLSSSSNKNFIISKDQTELTVDYEFIRKLFPAVAYNRTTTVSTTIMTTSTPTTTKNIIVVPTIIKATMGKPSTVTTRTTTFSTTIKTTGESPPTSKGTEKSSTRTKLTTPPTTIKTTKKSSTKTKLTTSPTTIKTTTKKSSTTLKLTTPPTTIKTTIEESSTTLKLTTPPTTIKTATEKFSTITEQGLSTTINNTRMEEASTTIIQTTQKPPTTINWTTGQIDDKKPLQAGTPLSNKIDIGRQFQSESKVPSSDMTETVPFDKSLKTIEEIAAEGRCPCPTKVEDPPSPAQKQARQSHASQMFIAWVILVPFSMFASRFYKETYSDVTFLQKPWWVTVHVLTLMTAWIFMMGGLYVLNLRKVRTDTKEWTSGMYAHIICGSAAIILFTIHLVLGPIIGWSRKPTWRIFQIILHWAMGMLEFILFVIAVYSAGMIRYGFMNCNVAIAFFAFILIILLFNIFMEIFMRQKVDKMLNLKPPRAYLPPPVMRLFGKNAPFSHCRVYCLVGYGILLIFFYLILFLFLLFPDRNCHQSCWEEGISI